MSLTNYVWTIYMDDRLFDIMTNEEVDEVLSVWTVKRIDTERGVIEFV